MDYFLMSPKLNLKYIILEYYLLYYVAYIRLDILTS